MYYKYNNITKEYLGVEEGQPSPLEPDVFFKPPSATDIVPHSLTDTTRTLVFNITDNIWTDVEDHRDNNIWLISDASKVQLELGDTIDNTMTMLDPTALSFPIWSVDVWVEDVDKLNAQAEAHFMSMTDAHIQAEVEKYNVANGVKFASIHNCTTYKDVAGYPHQTFCQNIIQWNADIWEAVRAYQGTNPVSPTDAEFQSVLDGVIFNG